MPTSPAIIRTARTFPQNPHFLIAICLKDNHINSLRLTLKIISNQNKYDEHLKRPLDHIAPRQRRAKFKNRTASDHRLGVRPASGC